MNYDPKLKICYDRPLKKGAHPTASTLHIMRDGALLRSTGAANARQAFRDIDPTSVIPAPHMAVINSKKWPDGSTLKCRFLEGSKTQQAKVIAKAKIWESYANIKIEFVSTNDEQVRIAFMPGQGSWSAIGVDALDEPSFPKSEPTMNFGWLEDDTDDIEYERVVVHEFGHAIGCVHEHQSPEENLQWNVEKVYAQFSGPPNNWTKEEIDSNILQKYSAAGLSATIFDRESIMLYQFPAELFLNGVGTPENTHLSTKDKAFIAQMYPGHVIQQKAPVSSMAAMRLTKLDQEIASNRQYLDAARRGRARLNMQSTRPVGVMREAMVASTPKSRTFSMLAQGDSWFNYWIGHDVLYWLEHDYGHKIDNIAVAGSTLNDEVYGPVPNDFLDFRQSDAPSRLAELVDRIKTDKPQVLLLSAGGNDIAGDEFFSFVNNSKSGLTPVNGGVLAGVISPTFMKAYQDMIQAALDAADSIGTKLTVFTHGYDYPWPDGRGVLWIRGAIGPWFDPSFNAKNYPNNSFADLVARRGILNQFIDALNAMLKSLESKYPGNVFHIDARNTLRETDNYRDEWANELHPTDAGFQKIARVFNDVIQAKM
jgi:lysophospholipase L1-like esterase